MGRLIGWTLCFSMLLFVMVFFGQWGLLIGGTLVVGAILAGLYIIHDDMTTRLDQLEKKLDELSRDKAEAEKKD